MKILDLILGRTMPEIDSDDAGDDRWNGASHFHRPEETARREFVDMVTYHSAEMARLENEIAAAQKSFNEHERIHTALHAAISSLDNVPEIDFGEMMDVYTVEEVEPAETHKVAPPETITSEELIHRINDSEDAIADKPNRFA